MAKKRKKKWTRTKSFKILLTGLWRDNPVFCMVLAICSSLAITNRVANAITMGLGVTFVLIFTEIIVSALRNFIPERVRLITYMVVISTFTIIVDRFLKAFSPTVSEALGPYVGLIITNCILMGRAEAFALKSSVKDSILDAIACGFGYAYLLILMAVVREFLGFGTLLGYKVAPAGWTNWAVMTIAPGAFFLLAVYLWVFRTILKKTEE